MGAAKIGGPGWRRLERHFFGAFFFNIPNGAENKSGAFWGRKMVSGAEKFAPNVLNLRTMISGEY